MNKVMEVIQQTVERTFDERGLDIDKFNHDITSFDVTNTQAMVIYDNGELERIFILIGLMPNPDNEKEWRVVYFKNTEEGAGAGNYDGLDAMSDANAFLNY